MSWKNGSVHRLQKTIQRNIIKMARNRTWELGLSSSEDEIKVEVF